ncbi:LytR/AlgR family response regulator transcription factor [Sphingobacterium sp. LRF_L2]|uniref:LytR/AlgR family response regulator transcription factor n=1 Tax=Sphingobacterium sp. LRF_L2 TaxID=3369421 RepID=UPI003F5EF176
MIYNYEEFRKMRAMVIDDEPDHVTYMKNELMSTQDVEVVYAGTDAQFAIKELYKLEVDIIILDMDMPRLSGLRFLSQLKLVQQSNRSLRDVQVVAFTAHRNYAADCYEHGVIDYMVKPVDYERISKALVRVKQRFLERGLLRLTVEEDYFFLYSDRGVRIKRICYKEIRCLEANGKQTLVWVNDNECYAINGLFSDVLKRFPPGTFMKVHRSFAISLLYFDRIEGKKIILLGLTKVDIKKQDRGVYPSFDRWLESNPIRGKLC